MSSSVIWHLLMRSSRLLTTKIAQSIQFNKLLKFAVHVLTDMRKAAFCTWKNKGTDQLRGNHTADQHLCFRYIDSSIPPFPNSAISNRQPSLVAVQPGLFQS